MPRDPAVPAAPAAAAAATAATAPAEALLAQLQAYTPYLCGQVAAEVLLVKGIPGPAELAGGGVFSGPDGPALSAILERLGWGSANWLGVLLGWEDRPDLSAYDLRLIIEIDDPLLVIATDVAACRLLLAAMTLPAAAEADWLYENESASAPIASVSPPISPPTAWQVGSEIQLLGRRFFALEGFEASLTDTHAKQQVWMQLKQIRRGDGS